MIVHVFAGIGVACLAVSVGMLVYAWVADASHPTAPTQDDSGWSESSARRLRPPTAVELEVTWLSYLADLYAEAEL